MFRKKDIPLSQICKQQPVSEVISLIKRHLLITFRFGKSSSLEIFDTLFLLIFFGWLMIFGVGIFRNSTQELLLSSEVIKELFWSPWGSAFKLIRDIWHFNSQVVVCLVCIFNIESCYTKANQLISSEGLFQKNPKKTMN